MKLLDKILYLQDSQKLSDHEFAHKFKIKQTSLLKWKKEQIVPKRSDLITLCNAFSLDIDDFILYLESFELKFKYVYEGVKNEK